MVGGARASACPPWSTVSHPSPWLLVSLAGPCRRGSRVKCTPLRYVPLRSAPPLTPSAGPAPPFVSHGEGGRPAWRGGVEANSNGTTHGKKSESESPVLPAVL